MVSLETHCPVGTGEQNGRGDGLRYAGFRPLVKARGRRAQGWRRLGSAVHRHDGHGGHACPGDFTRTPWIPASAGM